VKRFGLRHIEQHNAIKSVLRDQDAIVSLMLVDDNDYVVWMATPASKAGNRSAAGRSGRWWCYSGLLRNPTEQLACTVPSAAAAAPPPSVDERLRTFRSSSFGVEEDVWLADMPPPPADIRVPNGGELKASPCGALNLIVEHVVYYQEENVAPVLLGCGLLHLPKMASKLYLEWKEKAGGMAMVHSPRMSPQ